MITVTLGEAKPQEVKSFPKLMKVGERGVIWLMLSETKGIHLVGGNNFLPFEVHNAFGIENMQDYNEPITIQNA
jgi:hypothetical protein